MIIPLDDLRKHEFSLTDIKVILQNPQYRILVQGNRPCNGFLYILRGSCHYRFEGGEFTLSDGGLIYLPFGSHHTLTITSESIQFYRVDFTVHIGNEIARFYDRPLKLTDHAPAECVEAIKALESDYSLQEDSVARMQKLCTVLTCLQRSPKSPTAARLAPAVRYLQENVISGVSCVALADLCFLSPSRFYELFRAEFGVSPLSYRDRLLVRRAKTMLEAGDIPVKEIALSLGFETAAYFSRFFKKQTGMTPMTYKKGTV